MLFYIIFGTNLLTQSPLPVSVFSLFLSFAEKEYQTESNWPKKFTEIIFGPEESHGSSEMDQKSPEATTRVEGAPPALPLPRGPPWHETDAKNTYKS